MSNHETVTVQEVYRQGHDADLVDVRTPAESEEVHATISRNIPLDRLNPADVMSAKTGS